MLRWLSGPLLGLLCVLLVGCGGAEQREGDHLAKGLELYEAGDYTKAALEFRNVLQLNPDNAEARYHLARVAEQDGEWAAAFEAYERLLEVDPDHVQGHLRLARIQLMGNDLAATEERLDQLDQLEGAGPEVREEALVLRAAIAMRQGEEEQALEMLAPALEANPGNADAVAVAAGAQRQLGRTEQALALIDRALEADESLTSLRVLKIPLLVEEGRREDAVPVYRELIESRPDNATYRISLAQLLAGPRGRLSQGNR